MPHTAESLARSACWARHQQAALATYYAEILADPDKYGPVLQLAELKVRHFDRLAKLARQRVEKLLESSKRE